MIMLRRHGPRLLWWISWIAPIIGLWLLFVWLAAGSFNGRKELERQSVHFTGECGMEAENLRSCVMQYSYDGTSVAVGAAQSTAIPLAGVAESAWEGLFELPTRAFDRSICLTVSTEQPDTPSITLRLDSTAPEQSTIVTDGTACIPITENGNQQFHIRDPSLVAIAFPQSTQERVAGILSDAMEHFTPGEVQDDRIDTLHVDLVLTSELTHPHTIEILYFLAFILALHPVVLILEFSSFIHRSYNAVRSRSR